MVRRDQDVMTVQAVDDAFIGSAFASEQSMQYTNVNDITISHFVDVYPNPFKNTLNFRFNAEIPADLNITIYDLTGRKLISLTDQYDLSGISHFQWNAANLKTGIYMVRIRHGEMNFDARLVKLE